MCEAMLKQVYPHLGNIRWFHISNELEALLRLGLVLRVCINELENSIYLHPVLNSEFHSLSRLFELNSSVRDYHGSYLVDMFSVLQNLAISEIILLLRLGEAL
jgi:hypothetical protein